MGQTQRHHLLLSEITGVRQKSQSAFRGVGPGNLHSAGCTNAPLSPEASRPLCCPPFFYGASVGMALGLLIAVFALVLRSEFGHQLFAG